MDINHSDYWNNKYKNQDTPWHTGSVNFPIINSIKNINKYKICILGCGIAKDSILLSKMGHSVYAVDFALEPIEYLNNIKNKQDLDSLYPVNEDIFNLDESYLDFFDIVIEYTCFCAIDINRRSEYIQVVSKILKQNGEFLGLFFPIKRKDEELGKGPPFYVNLEETISMFENKFNIIKIDKNVESIKPRKGFETLVSMSKK